VVTTPWSQPDGLPRGRCSHIPRGVDAQRAITLGAAVNPRVRLRCASLVDWTGFEPAGTCHALIAGLNGAPTKEPRNRTVFPPPVGPAHDLRSVTLEGTPREGATSDHEPDVLAGRLIPRRPCGVLVGTAPGSRVIPSAE